MDDVLLPRNGVAGKLFISIDNESYISMFDNIEPYKERIPTFDEAVEVHKLLKRGFPVSQIAGLLQTNQGRISEINTGKRHYGSKQAAFG